jgi:hypothetical protein
MDKRISVWNILRTKNTDWMTIDIGMYNELNDTVTANYLRYRDPPSRQGARLYYRRVSDAGGGDRHRGV